MFACFLIAWCPRSFTVFERPLLYTWMLTFVVGLLTTIGRANKNKLEMDVLFCHTVHFYSIYTPLSQRARSGVIGGSCSLNKHHGLISRSWYRKWHEASAVSLCAAAGNRNYLQSKHNLFKFKIRAITSVTGSVSKVGHGGLMSSIHNEKDDITQTNCRTGWKQNVSYHMEKTGFLGYIYIVLYYWIQIGPMICLLHSHTPVMLA